MLFVYRVTLGTSLDKYTYTKRVGWVPAKCFADYTGPDLRKSSSLIDIATLSTQTSNEESRNHDNILGLEEAHTGSGAEPNRLSRSISDLTSGFGAVIIDDSGEIGDECMVGVNSNLIVVDYYSIFHMYQNQIEY